MTRTSLFAFALAAMSAGVALGQGSFDVIVTLEGAPKRGTITEMSKDSVGLEVSGGVVSKVELNNIKRVTFSDSPPQLSSALTSITGGQLEDALEKLKQIEKDNVQRDIVWQDVEYYKAYCLAKLALSGGGDKTAAGKAMGDFAKNEGSYHYYEANELMGDLANSLGKPDIAATFYGKVGGAPWPDYKMKAAVLEGQALVAQGNYKDAYQKFQQVVGATLNTPVATRMKEFAALGRAMCLSEAGKADEGVTEIEKIIANGDSRDGELFARAYNALGYCHLKAGRTKDALLAYLHVDLMFYQDPAQHAEALYYLRGLWKDIDKTEQSLKARTLLKQRYPGSVWASKAE
jgi:tetratricopeptide (TPR) repeat protein